MKRVIAGVLGMAMLTGGCGGSSPGPPTTPTPPVTNPPPPPQANRSPVINSMTVTPTFGVSQLTSISMTVAGSDPDGDPVTFEWDFGDGTRGSGTGFSKIYGGSGVATIRVTASDGRGATATDSRTTTIGSMEGNWAGTLTINAGQAAATTLALTQTGATVTGAMVLSGFSGRTDPAQPGRIDASGGVELRIRSATSPCAEPWTPPAAASPGPRSARASTGRRSPSTSADRMARPNQSCRRAVSGSRREARAAGA
jgi:hypothetical protein